jgi:thioredoxin-like negative regulator of GroEL
MAYEAEAARWISVGRPDQAASFYAATLGHRPGDTRVRMMLADCLVRSGRSSAAAGEYLRVALDYAAQRRDREAMALAHQVLHLDASQFVYVAVADALRGIGRAARDLCARAAEAHLQAGRLADGLHMLQLGAEIDARNPDVRRRLAQLYLSQHMVGPAVANLAEAGRLLLAAGNNAEYVAVAELLLRADPRHLATLRELPRVYLRMGEPQRAVVKLADLMRVSPGDTAGYETLAQAFAVIGRVPTALSVLERLTAELVAIGRAPQAAAILERARGWRLDDQDFTRAVMALLEPKSKADPTPTRAPAPSAGEGTVVLDITDLLVSGEWSVVPSGTRVASPRAPSAPEVLDLSNDVVEIGEVEGSLVLRVQDLSHVGRVPRNRPPGPPAPRHTAPPAPRRTALPTPRRAAPSAPRRAALPAPRQARPPVSPARPSISPVPAIELEATLDLDLSDLELDATLDLSDVELDQTTLVRRLSRGEVTSLVIDEESDDVRADPRSTAGRAAMARRGQALASRGRARV